MTETIIPKMNLRVIIDKDTIKVKDVNEVVLYFHKEFLHLRTFFLHHNHKDKATQQSEE